MLGFHQSMGEGDSEDEKEESPSNRTQSSGESDFADEEIKNLLKKLKL